MINQQISQSDEATAQPSISVCMTTFNGLPYVVEQISSILDQLPPNAEVICGDDSSTDGTREFLESIRDPRFRIVTSNRVGVVKNFEATLGLARNDMIFLSDQDDVWLPRKVNRVLEVMKQDVDLIVHNAVVVDSHLESIGDDYFDRLHPSTSVTRNLIKNTLIGAMMAFRREMLDAALPFPKSIGMHDIWLGLIGSACGQVVLLPEHLMMYRRHNTNASTTLAKSIRPLRDRVKERVLTAAELTRRLIERRCKVS